LKGKTFNRYIVGAKLAVTSQKQEGDETVYTFGVETYDSEYEVRDLKMYYTNSDHIDF
jgi:hypothetical protein